MKSSEAKKQFESVLNSLAYSKEMREVFNDLLDIIIYKMVIVDDVDLKRSPLTKYSKNDQEKMIELMLFLGHIMENDGEALTDALGDLFMQYISFGRNGQYFTPQPIADMIAKMSFDGKEVKAGQSVNDCACGSGRMLLGAAKINKELRFFGSDIDLTCVKMAVLNLSMNNLVGEIVWGNPLTFEHYASFQIRKDIFTNFPIIQIVNEDKSVSFKKTISRVIKKPQQLTLFD